MPALKARSPQPFKFSRDTLNVIDAISVELGGLSRRAVFEIIVRHVRKSRDKCGASYSDLLIASYEEPTPRGKR